MPRNQRGRPSNAPAAFIHPCQPTFAKQPPRGPGWAHKLKHDSYRLQIHMRNGVMRLYTMNGANWTARYPLIVSQTLSLYGNLIIDAEVVCLDKNGVPSFDALHERTNDDAAIACAFDLLMLNGRDLRKRPYIERKAALRKLLLNGQGIQYVEHIRGARRKAFGAVVSNWIS